MKKTLTFFAFLLVISFVGNNNNLFAQDDNKIYEEIEVDKKANFPDGYREFQKFIRDNYQYSKEFRRKGISGMMRIEFIVEKDGFLSNIKAFVDDQYDENMINTIKKSPKWIPAMHNKKIVRTKIKIPFCIKPGY